MHHPPRPSCIQPSGQTRATTEARSPYFSPSSSALAHDLPSASLTPLVIAETYGEDTVPLNLSCGHTACDGCVTLIVQAAQSQKFECPTCREVCAVQSARSQCGLSMCPVPKWAVSHPICNPLSPVALRCRDPSSQNQPQIHSSRQWSSGSSNGRLCCKPWECCACSAKFCMSANTQTLVLAPWGST